MKAKNSLFVFIFSMMLGGCFDSPDFSPVPRISFEKVEFGKSRDQLKPDSLVIHLTFEDGDGDLGVPNNFREDPFHEQNYFIGDNGNLIPVGKLSMAPNYPRFLNVPASVNGKLLVKKDRANGLYTNKMVSYTSDSACLYYNRIESVLLRTVDKRLLDETMTYTETPYQDPFGDPGFTSIIEVTDTFYVEKNPNYQNIDVRFYRKGADPSNPSKFAYVNWSKIFCTEIFDARFPVLTDKENALSGKIKYSMASTELETMMGDGIWKLRVTIRDRALNNSNTVESREFTLDEIRTGGG